MALALIVYFCGSGLRKCLINKNVCLKMTRQAIKKITNSDLSNNVVNISIAFFYKDKQKAREYQDGLIKYLFKVLYTSIKISYSDFVLLFVWVKILTQKSTILLNNSFVLS